MVGYSRYLVLPGAQRDGAAFDRHQHPRLERFEPVLRRPLVWRLRLFPVAVEVLPEVSLAVYECCGDNWQSLVCHRAQRVAGENAQPAGIRWDRRIQRAIHREVGTRNEER